MLHDYIDTHTPNWKPNDPPEQTRIFQKGLIYNHVDIGAPQGIVRKLDALHNQAVTTLGQRKQKKSIFEEERPS